jgi:hypothetical protein
VFVIAIGGRWSELIFLV